MLQPSLLITPPASPAHDEEPNRRLRTVRRVEPAQGAVEIGQPIGEIIHARRAFEGGVRPEINVAGIGG